MSICRIDVTGEKDMDFWNEKMIHNIINTVISAICFILVLIFWGSNFNYIAIGASITIIIHCVVDIVITKLNNKAREEMFDRVKNNLMEKIEEIEKENKEE